MKNDPRSSHPKMLTISNTTEKMCKILGKNLNMFYRIYLGIMKSL